jgi:hypothetical protein
MSEGGPGGEWAPKLHKKAESPPAFSAWGLALPPQSWHIEKRLTIVAEPLFYEDRSETRQRLSIFFRV